MKTYKITRFYKDDEKKNRVIARGLSLEEAQAHCRRNDTHKKDEWFDGYDTE